VLTFTLFAQVCARKPVGAPVLARQQPERFGQMVQKTNDFNFARLTTFNLEMGSKCYQFRACHHFADLGL
jgi:hypothetical protein